MKLSILVFAAAISLYCSAAAAAPANVRPHYDSRQMWHMELCVAYTWHVKRIATAKLAGRPIADMKKLYTNSDIPSEGYALVDKVYGDNVVAAWDYATDYFHDCAVRTSLVPKDAAFVPEDEMKPPIVCIVEAMVGDTAQQFRVAGKSKDDVYRFFATAPFNLIQRVIDAVYTDPKFMEDDAMKDTWHLCMAPLSGDWTPSK